MAHANDAKTKSTHVIDEFKVAANTIRCSCTWFGSADQFRQHQKDSKPTNLKISNPYAQKFGPSHSRRR